jgi:acyl-CoA synthetase (AMP-forming)/AMP-acid ligase II/thioesterase domain-containing protein
MLRRYASPPMPEATLHGLIATGGRSWPHAPAILAPDREPLTYAGLAATIETGQASLRDAGIGRTDRVALVSANGPEAATGFLAIAATAAAVPVNPTYQRDELAFELTDTGARAVVIQDGLATAADEVARALGIAVIRMTTPPGSPAGTIGLEPQELVRRRDGGAVDDSRAAPDDIALVLHTSGTTARPKSVPLRHDRLLASARTVAATLALSEADRVLNVMPLFHIHGLVAALLASLSTGGSVVTTPGFLAPSFFDWVDAFAPTWYTAVPTMHQAVLARAGAHADVIARRPLRLIRSSSASLPVTTLEGLEAAFGAPVIEAYGMTEAAHQMASNPLPPAARKPGSVGRATGIEIAILGPDGTRLPTTATGEVAIRGATVFDGYEANPDANARSFVDGWFLTGDQGWLDADGYLTLRGRLKELINRGGEKVGPIEVEEALLAVPGVAQAVVFAIPDARLGEDVGAAVVAHGGVTLHEHDLQATLADRLAGFKVPRLIRIVDEIPKGPTGKVQRIGMAERLGLADDPGRSPAATTDVTAVTAGAGPPLERVAPRTPMETLVAGTWADVLGVPSIGVTDDFFGLGGDSMLGAIIITRLHERLGRDDLPLITFLWAPTVERYARGLERGAWDVPASPLVPVRVEGTRPPFFLVHIDDVSLGPASLRRTLDPDQPLYGLRSMGLEGGNLPPSIEGLAGTFLEEVRRVQPEGPYLLGGYCSGGPIAIEMAKRLASDGQRVAFLGLVDPRLDRRRSIGWYARRPGYYLGRLGSHLRSGNLRQAARGLARQLAIRVTPPPDGEPLDHDRYLEALAGTRADIDSLHYPGRMVVFSSRDYDDDPAFWGRMADDLDWQPLPVAHETIFQGDDGATFASALSRSLAASTADRADGA